jgi:hypothetical protein
MRNGMVWPRPGAPLFSTGPVVPHTAGSTRGTIRPASLVFAPCSIRISSAGFSCRAPHIHSAVSSSPCRLGRRPSRSRARPSPSSGCSSASSPSASSAGRSSLFCTSPQHALGVFCTSLPTPPHYPPAPWAPGHQGGGLPGPALYRSTKRLGKGLGWRRGPGARAWPQAWVPYLGAHPQRPSNAAVEHPGSTLAAPWLSTHHVHGMDGRGCMLGQ